ncbi:MAG: sugar transferase, partial [Fusobacteriaceae bacterium]
MKRVFDFTMALIGLLILLPVIIVVSIAIKLTSPGKVLFSQRRLTKGMREFDIYKFRSMTSNHAREKGALQIRGNSSEITPLGKFLRKSKIDEIPQLWNILKGDMSFIGPRPELPRRLHH